MNGRLIRPRVSVRRWQDGTPPRRSWDSVAIEEPLEIRLETRSLAVVMRTPGHDEELAAGFLLSEGIVRSRADVRAIRSHPRNREGNVLDIHLAADRTVDFSRFTRHVFASSSCGLCGRATIDAVRQQFPPIQDLFLIDPNVFHGLPNKLRSDQRAFEATGGLHAAGVFNTRGELLLIREDVGRHNAVDKVLGRLLLDGTLPIRGGILLVSGRASFEIVQKALAGEIPVVAAVGAPSSLAVEFARANGQTLVGFLRDNRFNVYAGEKRLGTGRESGRRRKSV